MILRNRYECATLDSSHCCHNTRMCYLRFKFCCIGCWNTELQHNLTWFERSMQGCQVQSTQFSGNYVVDTQYTQKNRYIMQNNVYRHKSIIIIVITTNVLFSNIIIIPMNPIIVVTSNIFTALLECDFFLIGTSSICSASWGCSMLFIVPVLEHFMIDVVTSTTIGQVMDFDSAI